MTAPSENGTAPPQREEEPVLPVMPRDEHDVGWGEDPQAGRRDEDWYRRERPPHHE